MKYKEPFTVITADHSHVGFLSDFGTRSFIVSYQCTLPIEKLRNYTDQSFSKENICREMDLAEAAYFVGIDATGEPCGYAKLINSEPPIKLAEERGIELQRLYVEADCRGLGIGKALMKHSETYAHQQKHRILWLRVWKENTVAMNKYLRWGFSITGQAQYQVEDEERTVILMYKRLSTQQ